MIPLSVQPGRGPFNAIRRPAWCLVLWWVLAVFTAGPVAAQAVLPVPALTARVMDQTQTLTEADRGILESKLAAFEAERGSQVVVLLVPTTAPEEIVGYTQRVGDAWKIGRRDVGDGVLIVVAKDDRQLRIATTRAVEGAIPDLVAHRIIEQVITPAFREGRFADGLNAGVDHILARLRGEDLPLPDAPNASTRNGAETDEWMDLLVFIGFAAPMIAAVLRQMLGSKLGSAAAALAIGGMTWHLSGLVWLAVIVGLLGWLVSLALGHLPAHTAGRMGRSGRAGHWPHGGGGGWGSGSSGGGGFSSGGGGGFGGGGASGRW